MAPFDRDRRSADQEDVADVARDDVDPGKRPLTDRWAGPATERPVSTSVRAHVMRATRRDLGTAQVARWASPDGVAPDADDRVAAASASSGAPLPDPLRARFEASTGSDLSAVRVHTGDASQEAARSVAARAYTVGRDIHFAAGEYDPESVEGQRLLAHEVAHTVQQSAGAPVRQHKLEVSVPGDSAEVEADRAADAMLVGATAQIASAGPVVARGPDPAAPAAAPGAGPGDAPDRYKTLDPRVRDLLFRSQSSKLFDGCKGATFWDKLDEFGVASLQTMVQIVSGADKAGFLSCIDVAKEIYTYSGSWGIKFTGSPPPVGFPGWGFDLQYFVRKEHGDKGAANHNWYRQNSGAGNPGMHCGLDAGAGDHDLHIDPTNPMESVSDGVTPAKWIPPLIPGMPPLPVWAPKGQAIYAAWALVEHWQDIGKLPRWGNPTPTGQQPFLDIWTMDAKHAIKADEWANRENGAMANVKDAARAAAVISELHDAAKLAHDLNAESRPIAMQDNSSNPAPVAALQTKCNALRTKMLTAMANFFAHLKAEVPTEDVGGRESVGSWTLSPDFMYASDPIIDRVLKAREAAKFTPALARDATGPAPAKLPSSVSSALSSEQGAPLPDAQRWSGAVGADVSGARVVQGGAAAQAAADVNARAFTVGNRVFMGEGQSASGELLRHELVHVAQQQHAPAPSSWDSLQITNPHDAVEQEARGGAASSEGEVEIARDFLPDFIDIDAKTYVAYGTPNAQKILADLVGKRDAFDIPMDAELASWTGGGAKGFLAKAFAFTQDFRMQLALWLDGGIPTVDQLINNGRHLNMTTPTEDKPTSTLSDKGPSTYNPNVATELWDALRPKILESLNRMMSRYLDARTAAKMALGKNDSPDAPEPAPADIIKSASIDRYTADGLCSGVIKFDWEKYVGKHPDAAKAKTPRPVVVKLDQVAEHSFWVTATPKDGGPAATAEEVSLELYNSTDHALALIAAAPRFGSKEGRTLKSDWKDAIRAKAKTDLWDGACEVFLIGAGLGTDPVADLLKDPKKADQVAQEQASKYNATGASKDEIVKRLGENLGMVQAIDAGAKKMGVDGQLAAIETQIGQHETDLKKGDAGEATKWDAHSAKQHQVLRSVSDGMTGVVGFWDGMVDKLKDPSGKNIAEDIKALLTGAARDYCSVAAQSHLIEFAAQAAVRVSQKQTTLPFDIMECMLRASRRMVEEAAKHKGATQAYDVEGMRKREEALRQKISDARDQILKDPSMLQKLVDDLFAEVGDLQTEASMVANLDQLDDLITQFDDEDTWLANLPTDDPDSMGMGEHVPTMGEIIRDDIKQIKGWREKWKPIYAAWKKTEAIKDQAEQKKARDKVKTDLKNLLADGKYVAALQSLGKELNDIRKAKAILKIVLSIVAIIAITIVSMGAGLAMGGLATGLMAGAVEAGTITAATAATIAGGVSLVTEAAVFTAFNTVFFAENPTWKSVAFDFGSNLAMFGALKAIGKAYRSAAAVKTALESGGMGAKALAMGGEMGINWLTMNAAMLASEQIKHEVGLKKRDLTWDETKQIMAQSTGMMIAMAIVGRAAAPLFEQLEKSSVALGARVKGMNAARAELVATAVAAKGNPTPENIAKLISMDKAELRTELELFDAISKDPGALKAAGYSPEDIAAITHDTGLAVYEAKVAQALNANAVMVAAGQYKCTPAQKPAILDAYGKEAKVESVGKDDTAKTETLLITPKEGSAIRLTVGEAEVPNSKVDATADPKNAPPALGPDNTPPNLDGVPGGKEDIARWQTKGITTDAPDLWSKKAKDGTTFKDAYKKWIQQEHPYVEKNGVPEPVKPADVSAEAWGEFKSTFESIVKKGNITLTTRGADAVAKLKADGIDLSHLDPTSPEYAKVRPKILEALGKEALERWESSMLHGEGDPSRAALDARVKKALADGALDQLRTAFPDCEILLTGSMSQPGKPIAAIKDVDVILIAPDKATPDWRIAAEKRAGEMKLPAGKDLVEAGGPATLEVDAKVMTREQYLGLRSLDPKGRTPMNDFRVDSHAKTPEDIAKAAGLTDPADVAAFKTLFEKHPGFATELANQSTTNLTRIARMPPAQLAKLEALGEPAFRRIVTMPQPMFDRFIALPEAKLKLFAGLDPDGLARFEALTDRQFAAVAAMDPAKIQSIAAMPDADFAKATGSATTADAAYLQKVADFKGVHLDEVTAFYEKEMVFGIDHNSIIEAALAKYPTLTRAEADAIYGYTTKLFYRDLNHVLNNGGNPEAARLSTLLEKGLASMPAAPPIQYRGLRLAGPPEIAAFDAEYAMNAVVETKAYWSTGPDPGNAYAGGRTLVIHTTAAKDISELAFGVHFHGLIGKPTYSAEGIIPPGIKFRVVNVDTTTGTVTLQQM